MVFCDGGVIDVVPIGRGASWLVLLSCLYCRVWCFFMWGFCCCCVVTRMGILMMGVMMVGWLVVRRWG